MAASPRSCIEPIESPAESVRPTRTEAAAEAITNSAASGDVRRSRIAGGAAKHNPWFLLRILSLSLTVAAAGSLGLCFAGAGESSTGSQLIVDTDGLNVRAQPTAHSEIVGRLKQGDTVSVVEHDSLAGWAQLLSPPDIGGWIDVAYTTPTSADGDWPTAPWFIPPWWTYVAVSCLAIVAWKRHRAVERTRCGRCQRLYAWQRIASKELDRWVGSEVQAFSQKARGRLSPGQPESVEIDVTSYVARPVTRVRREHTLQCRHCGNVRLVVAVDTLT